jgi:hypothetical protein
VNDNVLGKLVDVCIWQILFGTAISIWPNIPIW